MPNSKIIDIFFRHKRTYTIADVTHVYVRYMTPFHTI